MYSLVGVNGNAFSVMGYVTRIMKRNHYSKAAMDEYVNDAMSGDYDHLLQVSMNMGDELNEVNPDDEDDW